MEIVFVLLTSSWVLVTLFFFMEHYFFSSNWTEILIEYFNDEIYHYTILLMLEVFLYMFCLFWLMNKAPLAYGRVEYGQDGKKI